MKNYNLKDFTIGADIEVFLVDDNETPVSAIGIIPGTKEKPHKLTKELGKWYALQTDNVLAEFNIPPTKTQKEFTGSIDKMIQYINQFVSNKGLHVKCVSSMNYPEKELQSDEAKHFGCDADFCVYTMEKNHIDRSKIDPTLRSSGFHIHVGYPTEMDIKDKLLLIKYMDEYVGMKSVQLDKDTKRRLLYGKAGCFRLTDYGVEYRTIGGGCIDYSDKIFKYTIDAINAFINETKLTESEIVENTINK